MKKSRARKLSDGFLAGALHRAVQNAGNCNAQPASTASDHNRRQVVWVEG